MTVSNFYSTPCILGESPVWHKKRNTCFWTDIEGKKIYEQSLDGRKKNYWEIDRRASLLIPFTQNSLILAVQGGIAEFDLEKGSMRWLCIIEEQLPANRCNDGAIDSKGRLWVGTMNVSCEPMAGALYCIDDTLQPMLKIPQLSITNGLVWSLDNKTMYHIDSPKFCVQAYAFDEYTGNITPNEIAVKIPESMGSPDGMCIDEEGMLWVAHWGGFAVRRWNPNNGELLQTITFPVPQVSSCAFVGENLDRLLVTTARENMRPEQLTSYPESGNVYLVEGLGIKGVADFEWKGVGVNT